MIRDGRTVSSGITLDFDVCIVGAGPVGLVLSERLAASGIRVAVLESGGERPEPSSRRLSQGRRSGEPYFRLEHTRERSVGGTSSRWGSHWPAEGGLRSRRLDPQDFERRSHVPLSGWPISAEELEPWFEAAEQFCGIGVFAEPAEPDVDDDATVRTTWSSFADPARFRINGSSRAATVLTHSNVIAMQPAADGETIASLRVGVPGAGWFSVTAREFVLAGGGIENARLLLASEIGGPGGIANPNDQVGRYFMEHLHVESGELRLASGSALPVGRYLRHHSAGTPVIGAFQLSANAQSAHHLLNTTVELRPRSPRFFSPGVRSLAEVAWAVRERQIPPHLAGHVRNVVTHPREVGAAIATRLTSKRSLGGTSHALVLTSEQAPNPRSRITLDTKRDAFGVPLPWLRWELLPIDSHSIRETLNVLDAALRSASLGEIGHKWGETTPAPYVHGCNHHIGTTRMSVDATTGVVDRDCKVHGMANLFVAGSSVMPTAGAVTVTLAALALAMRLAEHLTKTVPAVIA